MTSCLGNMVLGLSRLLTAVALLLMMGCSSSPTVSEGSQYIQMQADRIEYNSYATQLQVIQKQLTEVAPEFREVAPLPPQSRVGDLTRWLEQNNCLLPGLSPTERVYCYQVTRVYLIQTTKTLDAQDTTVWAAKRTIQQLVGNLNKVIDMAPRQTTDQVPP